MAQSNSSISRRRSVRGKVLDRSFGAFLRCRKLYPKLLRVVNVAEFGARIELPEVGFAPPVPGEIYDAVLTVGYSVMKLRIRFVHVEKNTAGIEFVEPTEFQRGALRWFFEPEMLGASLRLDEREKSEDDESGVSMRYVDSRSNTLEITTEDGKLSSFRLRVGLVGDTVDWSSEDPETLLRRGRKRKKPMGDFQRKQLIRIIRNIENLDDGVRQVLEFVVRTGR